MVSHSSLSNILAKDHQFFVFALYYRNKIFFITTAGLNGLLYAAYRNGILYARNFLQHVYFTVKHGNRIFAVEISRMKVIQKFSRFSCHATKNLCYYFKRDRQSLQIVYHMYS